MTISDGNVAVLLSVLWSYATNDEDRMMCHRMVDEMRKDGESSEKIVENLAGALVDGLRHGNWPWVVSRMSHLDNWQTKNHPRPRRDPEEFPPRLSGGKKAPKLDSPEAPDPFAGNGNS